MVAITADLLKRHLRGSPELEFPPCVLADGAADDMSSFEHGDLYTRQSPEALERRDRRDCQVG